MYHSNKLYFKVVRQMSRVVCPVTTFLAYLLKYTMTMTMMASVLFLSPIPSWFLLIGP